MLRNTLQPKTRDLAVGRWPGILTALGMDAKHLKNAHGPCPVCGGTDRFRFDDKGGRGTWICSHCGPGDGFDLLARVYGWDFRQAVREIERVIGTVAVQAVKAEQSEAERVAACRRILAESRPVVPGDAVSQYLVARIGSDFLATADVRFHPHLWHTDGGHHPAMVCVIRDAAGRGAGLHRTYLTADGRKADVTDAKKAMKARSLAGAAVRLGPIAPKMGIAEGIETALAASTLFDVPVWAATTATLLEQWTPPNGVKEVVVFADNDANYAGHAAAYALAHRLSMQGLTVSVEVPHRAGADFADIRSHA